ncbi:MULTISPECIES: Rieske (2Fe-2S) protein [Haladaptatus]|uniref:Assimilatory nitrite reductase (NAD(P)H) small subunit n=1 Tax=Haladaptatus paucihalophilus DX253 TaxID=797209 RepID=A0A1M6NEY2_HALPU|nr:MULTISPECIES: Rieske 2Fe-2S domain-containing protein [Haladaptatus]GKZ12391.1 hypothetical protein HAL_02720 [Haladaptatus sp. T7]SHJ94223.1 assimilatory nitrite reductase (NAD(P)H) small subunit [Haladaptatus paucihalophilus DX253]
MVEPAVEVGGRAEFPEGEGTMVEFDGREIAVFRSGDEFYAVENKCPHQGGPLSDGKVEETSVFCPWHGFEFDLTTGEHSHLGDLCVETYAAFVEDGTVYLSKE